jgi:hypothetical protein
LCPAKGAGHRNVKSALGSCLYFRAGRPAKVIGGKYLAKGENMWKKKEKEERMRKL